MKPFAAALILLALAISSAESIAAQQVWTDVSPKGEHFWVLMPAAPTTTSQKYVVGQFNVEGRSYSVTSNDIEYTVWSLKNPRYASYKSTEGESYVDGCVDLVWDGLLKPWRDSSRSSEPDSHMTYTPGLASIKLAGPDYSFLIGNKRGVVHLMVKDERLYVLVVVNADSQSENVPRFMNSFSLEPRKAEVAEVTNPSENRGGGVGVGTGSGLPPDKTDQPRNMGGGSVVIDPNDYNRVFSGRQVTEKARIISKPAPHYTGRARRYSVQGKVLIQAVFAKSGEVTNIRVLKGLPQGLSQKAIEAVREIKFVPATKDGQQVSQYQHLEIEFKLY